MTLTWENAAQAIQQNFCQLYPWAEPCRSLFKSLASDNKYPVKSGECETVTLLDENGKPLVEHSKSHIPKTVTAQVLTGSYFL